MLPSTRPKRRPIPSTTLVKPWRIAVCVDDCIIVVLSLKGISFLQQVARATLYSIHAIFPPPSVSGHTGLKDPVSLKKMEKEDGKLEIKKEILGFIANGEKRTWCLPSKKKEAIIKELRLLRKNVRIPHRRPERLTGKLINATRITPVAKGLLTPFFDALNNGPHLPKILKAIFDLHHAIADLIVLLNNLESRPTHIRKLIPFPPVAVGMVDASCTRGRQRGLLGAPLLPTYSLSTSL